MNKTTILGAALNLTTAAFIISGTICIHDWIQDIKDRRARVEKEKAIDQHYIKFITIFTIWLDQNKTCQTKFIRDESLCILEDLRYTFPNAYTNFLVVLTGIMTNERLTVDERIDQIHKIMQVYDKLVQRAKHL